MRPSPSVPCELCGAPGFFLMRPVPVSVVAESLEDLTKWEPPKPLQACEQHFGIVRMRAQREDDPERFAYEHQTPLPTPTQIRESMLHIADMLEEMGEPLRAARFRAIGHQEDGQ